MKFTGQPKHQEIDMSIMHRAAYQDAELVEIFVEAILLLAKAVGAGRVMDTSGDGDAEQWAKEFLVGYGLLAIGEARSLLLLLCDGLNLNARVHFRSLYEYQLKITLLLDDEEKVLAFRDAFAYEMRDFATKLGKAPEEIDAEIERVLGIDDASVVTGTRENKALGGTVKEQMKSDLQPEARYLTTFSWASQVSHGSVLALNELAKVTDGKANDFITVSTLDKKGNDLLYDALWVIFQFVVLIEQEFSIGIPGSDDLIKRANDLNTRLKIFTPEQEAAVKRLREEKRKREADN